MGFGFGGVRKRKRGAHRRRKMRNFDGYIFNGCSVEYIGWIEINVMLFRLEVFFGF